MKNENEFNAYLGKELRKLRNPRGFAYMKMSERFQEGASDFYLAQGGVSAFVECKFISELPVKLTTKVLGHQFTGAQLKFLDDMELGGIKGYGLVAVKRLEVMVLVGRHYVKEWTLGEFIQLLQSNQANTIAWHDVPLLLAVLFPKNYQITDYEQKSRGGIEILMTTGSAHT